MGEVTNTTEQMKDPAHRLGFLAGSMGGDPSAPILAQEAQGQREIVHSDVLPRVNSVSDDKDADFEALGFVFGEQVEGDPLFRRASLPEGWTREGSSHSMWSYLCDERGVQRVAVFYKAAFYDRDAFMHRINPGFEAASKFLYSEPGDPGYAETFEVDPRFTEEERKDALAKAQSYAEDPYYREHHPERVARAQQIIAAGHGVPYTGR